MELVIAVISLMWVIGILSLQRIDAVVDEFTKALAYYLSLDRNGAIDQVQLSVKSLLPKTAIENLLHQLASAPDRWDRGGLKKSVRFFKIAKWVKQGFEVLLIITTLVLPGLYLIDFSHSPFTFADKDVVAYLVFFAVVMVALGSERVLSYFSGKLYPLSIRLGSGAEG